MTGISAQSPDPLFTHSRVGCACVNGLTLRKTMGRHMWAIPTWHGTNGWRMTTRDDWPNPEDPERGSIIVTSGTWPDGVEYIHASITFRDRYPDYPELRNLHLAVWGGTGWALQAFVPTNRHINDLEHCLHLFGRADGAPFYPDFAYLGTI